MPLYPLTFEPIFKQTLWGGNRLREILHKPSPDRTGESWEIAALQGADTFVRKGPLKGHSLSSLCSQYGEELLGSKVVTRTGQKFPLLFKFIDARKDLSLQVHPDNALARVRHHCSGKTEMWYIIDSQKDARLINGFARKLPQTEYKDALKTGKILDYVRYYNAQQADAFFIPAGRIHAIGGGFLVAEIQQASDITYRLYDYNRKDSAGRQRPLHVQEGFQALNFSVRKGGSLKARWQPNIANPLVVCPFFCVNALAVNNVCVRDLHLQGSFVVYMTLSGSARLHCNGEIYPLSTGNCILIPAVRTQYTLTGNAQFLEVYV